jgi:enoyl-CoA hydratase/carnithine racemase
VETPSILYAVSDRIATITLNRPDKLNALTAPMIADFIEALDEADRDDAVQAVIVTGNGRAFCAGADLSAGAATFDSAGADTRDGGGLLTLRLYRCLKPVIAAIQGAAAGAGVTMTLAMDARLASTDARFGLVFTRRGIVPESASSWFLQRIVGLDRALDWCLSGRIVPAQEALDARLVRSLHAPEELLDAARAYALSIVEHTSPVSVALTRQMLWRMAGARDPMEAHRLDSRGMQARGASADAREGVQSFLDKRKPNFPDKVSTDMPAFFPWWQEDEF